MSMNLSPETDQRIRTAVPLIITSLRVILAPLLLLWAWNGRVGIPFAIALVVGAGTDFLDGILARRLGVATAIVRRADGAADVIFYLTEY